MPNRQLDWWSGQVDTGQAPRISGTSGTWTNVTPAGISLNQSYSNGINGTTDDNYGCQDIVADPRFPGSAYLFTCYQGCWQTTDYGLTWIKKSTQGGPLDFGKNWGEAMGADGRLYATSGNNANTQTGGEGRLRVLRSADDGVTWTGSPQLAAEPYNVSIDPADPSHLIIAMHDDDHLWESQDSGASWTDRGQVLDGANSASISGFVHFVDSTTALFVSQTGGAANDVGIFKCVRASSGAWTYTRVHATGVHEHGMNQIQIDRVNDWLYLPTEAGMLRTPASGALTTWTSLNPVAQDLCAMTATTLYGMRSAPAGGTTDPKIYTAARTAGSTWSLMTTPAGMDNGGKTLCAMTDGVRWVLLAGCWLDGVWRYVE